MKYAFTAAGGHRQKFAASGGNDLVEKTSWAFAHAPIRPGLFSKREEVR